jgi:hypothetical protein
MADRSDEKRDKQAGDILGLGGVTGGHKVTNSLGSDEEARRRRMREGADELVPDTTGTTEATPQGAGATGIDMGSGGEGTDIER